VLIGTRHRLENPGSDLPRTSDVQVADQVDEKDIVRYEDQYGRSV
jgi:mannose-1-phosphate guanylyltransferase/mannose-6-phosphate isomerase